MGIRKTWAMAILAAGTFIACNSGGGEVGPCEANDPRPECLPTPCVEGDTRPECQPIVCETGDTRPECQPDDCAPNDPRPECEVVISPCVENDPRPQCAGDGSLGDICSVPSDCQSSLCVALGSGVGERICSRRCETANDCEDNTWECILVDSTSGDDVRTCIPAGNCLDRDGDGYGIGAGCLGRDCDDNDINTYPGAPELCDNKDNNCDGVVDEMVADARQECTVPGAQGRCAVGETACIDGTLICEQIVQPNQVPETCNGIDDDCDGDIDNNIPQVGQTCRPAGSDCANGTMQCDPDLGIFCDGQGSTELDTLCDGLDENCNGRVDEDVPGLGAVCEAGQGVCRQLGQRICAADPTAPPVCNAVPNSAAATTETCNYADDNCDGVVDEPFSRAFGNLRVYDKVATCGSCENDCNSAWTADQLTGTQPTCAVEESVAQCDYTCRGDYVDADGRETNGCELLPDAAAIYVTTPNKGGDDTSDCGNWDEPCATISHGITRAAGTSGKTKVLVAEGIYREGIALRSGISVLGGHSSLNFLRNINEYSTIIYGAAAPTTWGGVASDTDSVAVVARDITNATELSGFTIIAPDGGASGNSIGVFVRNSGSQLTIRDNTIQAGIGGQGASGTAGSNGSVGAGGAAGVAGGALNSSSCDASNHKAGGAAGTNTCAVPSGGTINVSGAAGSVADCPTYGGASAQPSAGNGTLPNSGEPGAAGFSAYGRGNNGTAYFPRPDRVNESFARDGEPGGQGANGEPGAGASSATGTVQTSSGMWRASTGGNASAGAPGGGGGGGGAAPGLVVCSGGGSGGMTGCTGNRSVGSSGGGGGAGGCGGTQALGGGGGGGAFAIVITYGSFNSLPTITTNTLVRNSAGQGGDGGIGGTGGAGGVGAVGGAAGNFSSAQAGRRGGDGGNGGHGGGGGGGAGGSSYGILIRGTSNTGSLQTNNTFTVPAGTNLAGAGGPGGGSMGNSGTNGVAGGSGHIQAQ